MEKIASVTTMTNTDVTTADVVAAPTLSAPPRTWNPLKQPIKAISTPKTKLLVTPRDQLLHLSPIQYSVDEAQRLWNDLIEYHAPYRRVDDAYLGVSLAVSVGFRSVIIGKSYANGIMDTNQAEIIGHGHFVDIREHLARNLFAIL